MEFQRILELVDVIGECEFLPPGNFYRWARENAIRQIQETYITNVGVKFFVAWPSDVPGSAEVQNGHEGSAQR